MAWFVFTIALAAVIVTVEASASDDCLAGPNAAAPQGSHWYYRVDHTTHRECWYLGPEGKEVRAGAHQDGSPVRSRSSNKMSAQLASQTPAQAENAKAKGARPLAAEAVPAEITPGQAKTSEDNSVVNAMLWSALPTSTFSIDPGLASTGNKHPEEPSMTDSEDEMPLIWPILSPTELSAAQRQPEFPISFAQLGAVFAVVLGFVAMIGHMIFKPTAARRPSRSGSRNRAVLAASTHRPSKQLPPTAAIVAATAHQAEIACSADKASSPPSDPPVDIESSVRRLLQELQRPQREDKRPASDLASEHSRCRSNWTSANPLVKSEMLSFLGGSQCLAQQDRLKTTQPSRRHAA
jgi:hypothetical protein